MSLEHLVQEGKEVLQLPPPPFHIAEDVSEGRREQLRSSQWPKRNDLSSKIKQHWIITHNIKSIFMTLYWSK